MLLPDNINPEHSIYYNGGIILKELSHVEKCKLGYLFEIVKTKYSMSSTTFFLSMDWLFLIEIVFVDEEGEVHYVHKES